MNSSRSHLRFHHALDVDILREADVAVPQDRLDGFVIDAQGVKVRREAAPEGVPAVPLRWRFVSGEMRRWQVFDVKVTHCYILVGGLSK